MMNLESLIDELMPLSKQELYNKLIAPLTSSEGMIDLMSLMKMFHSIAHDNNWPKETCYQFDRMMITMVILGQHLQPNSNSASGGVVNTNLLSRDSVDYVLSGWSNEPSAHFNGLSPNDKQCLTDISKFAIEEVFRSHTEQHGPMQPMHMDTNSLFQIVMDAAVIVHQAGAHHQQASMLEQTFTVIENDDE